MLMGIFFSALGVSLSIQSNLGATPIGVCPAVFSPFFKISTGMGMGILLAIFFGAQILILKKEFRPFQWLQLVAAVIYSGFVDITTNLVSLFPLGALWQQVLFCGLGTIILALGVFTMLKTDFIMLPQDAVVNVICTKYGKEYGKVKIALDSTLTIIAVIGSWILYRKFAQVGMGTVVAAIFVGRIISGLKNIEGINVLLERAMGEMGKENQYGSSKNNIFATSKNE